ncbi:MAG: hypothetical protein ACTSR6_13885 [Candidatus Heimdallarchaeota archaeon]
MNRADEQKIIRELQNGSKENIDKIAKRGEPLNDLRKTKQSGATVQ